MSLSSSVPPLGPLDMERCVNIAQRASRPAYRGRVEKVAGLLLEASGVPAATGELCRIEVGGPRGTVDAEVVGFRGSTTLLMPHGDMEGFAPRQIVRALGRPFAVPVGMELLGRAIDGCGRAIDGGEPIRTRHTRAVRSEAPAPLSREPISDPLQTGVRVIDGLTTIGRGQRIGIFSGSGVGKSTLLGQITRGTDADVTVVALVGERGREVRAFVDDVLGPDGMQNAVLVVATSDRPPIERFLAPFVAVTIAESFRDRGLDTLVVMDSITRFATASREIGLAAGEPPTVRGFPPSFFAIVPKLIERMGRTSTGSITGLLTILLEGDDENDPVADTLRGLLDGHIFLRRELANAGQFPAVDPLGSLSRLMNEIASDDHKDGARFVRENLAAWKEGRDLVEIGAYKPGTNPRLDRAIAVMPAIEAFVRQQDQGASPLAETIEMLNLIRMSVEGPGQ